MYADDDRKVLSLGLLRSVHIQLLHFPVVVSIYNIIPAVYVLRGIHKRIALVI